MQRIRTEEVDRILRQYLGGRSDLGFWNALAPNILEPHSPFGPGTRKRPQRWFLLFLMSSIAALAAFGYFNFWN